MGHSADYIHIVLQQQTWKNVEKTWSRDFPRQPITCIPHEHSTFYFTHSAIPAEKIKWNLSERQKQAVQTAVNFNKKSKNDFWHILCDMCMAVLLRLLTFDSWSHVGHLVQTVMISMIGYSESQE